MFVFRLGNPGSVSSLTTIFNFQDEMTSCSNAFEKTNELLSFHLINNNTTFPCNLAVT